MNVPADVQARIKADVDKYVALAATHFGKTYMTPQITYNVRGTNAGLAHGQWKVEFNAVLLMENLEEFIARTVPHEVAHCIDCANGRDQNNWSMFRRVKRSVHGPSWQAIMAVFGVDDSTRCHSYDVANARVKTKAKFEYKCKCCDKSFFVSSVLHNRMKAGQLRWCRRGGRDRGQLVFVGGLGKVDYKQAIQLAAQRKLHAKSEDPATRLCAKIPPNMLPPAVRNKMYPQVPPVAVKPLPKSLESNATIAKSIWTRYGDAGRQLFIERCSNHGMKPATASTYYANLKAGRM